MLDVADIRKTIPEMRELESIILGKKLASLRNLSKSMIVEWSMTLEHNGP